MANSYNLSPAPWTGTSTWGQIPGNIDAPPSRYQGVKSIYGNLDNLVGDAGQAITNQVKGWLSPETINTVQDNAASFGVASGLPSTNFSGYRGLRNLGRNVEDQIGKGLGNLDKWMTTMGALVDDPALLAQIASWNSVMNAAPDPTRYANALKQQYLDMMTKMGQAGRTVTGGTGLPSLSTPRNSPLTPASPDTAGGGGNPDWFMTTYGMTPGEYYDSFPDVNSGSPTGQGDLLDWWWGNGGEDVGLGDWLGSYLGGSPAGGNYDPNTWASWEDELFGGG